MTLSCKGTKKGHSNLLNHFNINYFYNDTLLAGDEEMVWDESKDRKDLRNMIIILIVILIVAGYLISHFGPLLIEYFNSTLPATNTSNNTVIPI